MTSQSSEDEVFPTDRHGTFPRPRKRPSQSAFVPRKKDCQSAGCSSNWVRNHVRHDHPPAVIGLFRVRFLLLGFWKLSLDWFVILTTSRSWKEKDVFGSGLEVWSSASLLHSHCLWIPLGSFVCYIQAPRQDVSKSSGMLNSLDPDGYAIGLAFVWMEDVMQVCGDTAGRRLWYVDDDACPVDDLSAQCFVSTSPIEWETGRLFVPPKYLFFEGYIAVT